MSSRLYAATELLERGSVGNVNKSPCTLHSALRVKTNRKRPKALVFVLFWFRSIVEPFSVIVRALGEGIRTQLCE